MAKCIMYCNIRGFAKLSSALHCADNSYIDCKDLEFVLDMVLQRGDSDCLNKKLTSVGSEIAWLDFKRLHYKIKWHAFNPYQDLTSWRLSIFVILFPVIPYVLVIQLEQNWPYYNKSAFMFFIHFRLCNSVLRKFWVHILEIKFERFGWSFFCKHWMEVN